MIENELEAPLRTAIAILDGINRNQVNFNGYELGALIYQLECFLHEDEGEDMVRLGLIRHK